MAVNKNRIAVLETARLPLVIRSNPTQKSVFGFVEEQHRRLVAGEPCGPSGEPAFQITGAKYYESEEAWLAGKPGKTIPLSASLLAASKS